MKKLKISAAVIIGLLAASSATFAQNTYVKNHPRRHEVNTRLAHQNARIDHEVRDGEITRAKAARLHADDRRLRSEERAQASRDHGHITRRERARLNRQENQVSKRIGS